MSEKIYCGNARTVTTQHGDLTKISMSKSDVNEIVKYMKDNGLEWVNIVVKEKREKKEGKPTHYLEIDQWKPDKQDSSSDLPF